MIYIIKHVSCCYLPSDKRVIVISLVALELSNLRIEAQNCSFQQSIGYRNSVGLIRTMYLEMFPTPLTNERTIYM